MDDSKQPKWYRELKIFSSIKPLLILDGDVMDSFVYPENTDDCPKGSILNINDYLYNFYRGIGYKHIIFYNNLRGFFSDKDTKAVEMLGDLIDEKIGQEIPFSAADINRTALSIIEKSLLQIKEPVVFVLDFVSRYIVGPNQVDQNSVNSFNSLIQSVLRAKEPNKIKNSVVMLVNKINDLPSWFYLENPVCKLIHLTPPNREERLEFVDSNFKSFFDKNIYAQEFPTYEDRPDELAKIKERFAGITGGFSYKEIDSLRKLCKSQSFKLDELPKVVDLYRFGVKDNPWDKIKTEELKRAESDFKKRVKGQDLAIEKTLDIIKRAKTGLSGLQHSSHSKPKGILFFAGPTGTGKTETAKTLAEKLFGDENKCIRFDMSEYQQPASDQRLLGAPPGYVGYEAGGQLTNAVRENPFSILLFDEIEKAHSSVMDKFLQILEDGRMTDGQGNTVYFSECIIIFTSNLGIYEDDENGKKILKVSSKDDYETVQNKVRFGVENHFKTKLGRPEILNRIGENIVVFDFIRPNVANKILNSLIYNKIVPELEKNKKIKLTLSQETLTLLENEALNNLEQGGRGIGNVVESKLINPLARYIFDNDIKEGDSIHIKNIEITADHISIVC